MPSSETLPSAPNASALLTLLRSILRMGSARDVVLAGWLFVALACGFLAYISRMHEITHDVFHEMALFREILVRGAFPLHDVFAYTPTVNPQVHHEWGTGLILYLVTVESGLGLAGLSGLRLCLIAALWLLLYRVARMRGAHPYVFACVAVVAFPVFWVGFSMLRAQLFTLVFLAAQMWMQELDRRGRRVWVIGWWLMLVAWLNIHAGFVVGLGMLSLHCIERFGAVWLRHRSFTAALAETWHLILACAAAPLALPVNPYGWQYVPYLFHAIGMPRPLIQEWHPLWHASAPTITLSLFALSIMLVLYGLRQMRLTRMTGALFMLVCAFETLKHIRHGSIYGAVWLAYAPAWLSHTHVGRSLVQAVDGQRRWVIRASQSIAAACLIFACSNQFWRPTLPAAPAASSACQPVGAVAYLKRHHFQGNLLTQFNQGAYVSWELHPDVKVSLDGRYEVAYPTHVIDSFHRFVTGAEGWEAVLDRYDSDAMLINQQAEVRGKLEIFRDEHFGGTRPGRKRWRFVYEDDAFVILAAEGTMLPYENRLQQPLSDGASSLFTSEHSHRARRRNLPIFSQCAAALPVAAVGGEFGGEFGRARLPPSRFSTMIDAELRRVYIATTLVECPSPSAKTHLDSWPASHLPLPRPRQSTR